MASSTASCHPALAVPSNATRKGTHGEGYDGEVWRVYETTTHGWLRMSSHLRSLGYLRFLCGWGFIMDRVIGLMILLSLYAGKFERYWSYRSQQRIHNAMCRKLISLSLLLLFPVALAGGSAALTGCDTAGGGECCRICETGRACGDSCISRSSSCNAGPGCACNG